MHHISSYHNPNFIKNIKLFQHHVLKIKWGFHFFILFFYSTLKHTEPRLQAPSRTPPGHPPRPCAALEASRATSWQCEGRGGATTSVLHRFEREKTEEVSLMIKNESLENEVKLVVQVICQLIFFAFFCSRLRQVLVLLKWWYSWWLILIFWIFMLSYGHGSQESSLP